MPNKAIDSGSLEETFSKASDKATDNILDNSGKIKGWDDGIYTHIAACVPHEEGAYLINRFGLRFDEVTPANLVKVNLQGDVLCGLGPP